MTAQVPVTDPQKVKQTVAKLRQYRLAMEEATLGLEDITAQIEHNSRQKSLNRLISQRSCPGTKSET